MIISLNFVSFVCLDPFISELSELVSNFRNHYLDLRKMKFKKTLVLACVIYAAFISLISLNHSLASRFNSDFNELQSVFQCLSNNNSRVAANGPLGRRRDIQCKLSNVCINRQNGLFYVNGKPPKDDIPNLVSADLESDQYWLPESISGAHTDRIIYLKNTTLLVATPYFSGHLSHWLYNTMVPIYDALRNPSSKGNVDLLIIQTTLDQKPGIFPIQVLSPPVSRIFWAARQWRHFQFTWLDLWRSGGWQYNFLPPKDYIPTLPSNISPNLSISGDTERFNKAFELLNDGTTMCYETAIFGTGNACFFDYCASPLAANTVSLFRSAVFSYLHIKENRTAALLTKLFRTFPSFNYHELPRKPDSLSHRVYPTVVFLNRLTTRRILNSESVIKMVTEQFNLPLIAVNNDVAFQNGTDETSLALKMTYPFNVSRNVPNLRFVDQVHIFKSASIVIAPHGNGLGNILWMDKGTVLIECFGYQAVSAWFGPVAASAQVNRLECFCNDQNRCQDPRKEPDWKKRDVYVDMSNLKTLLQKAVDLLKKQF